jgi:phage-related protein
MGESSWVFRCTDCDYRGTAASRALAERLADVHRNPSGHDVTVYPEPPSP